MDRVVTVGSYNIMSGIFSKQWLISLLLIPYFKTSYFDFVPGLSMICNVMLAAECIFFVGINILERRFTVFSKIILILEVWIYFIAPLISKAERPSFFYLMSALGILSFFELGMSRNEYNVITATGRLFTIMILLNILTHTVLPEITTSDGSVLYLFGLRTGFSLFIIPGILFNLLRDKMNQKFSIQTLITFVGGTFSLFEQMVVTGILELLIIIILLILLKNKKISEKINFALVAVLLLLLDISMTVFGAQNNIMNSIAIFFNKDLSLSGRTTIWEKVIEKLSHSPIAGFGADSNVSIGLTERPAHNQWLHVAMEGGYVAMAILILAVIISFIYLYKKKKSEWYTIVSVCTIAILVGSITEIQTYVPFFYVVLSLPFIISEKLKTDSKFVNNIARGSK